MDPAPTAAPEASEPPVAPGALRPPSPAVPNCPPSTPGFWPTTSTDPDPQDDLSRAQNPRQEQLPVAGAGVPCGPPPPLATYATFAEADKAVKSHALGNGYSLTVKEIWPRGADATTATRYTYRCGKGRTAPASQADPTAHTSKRRKTSTQMTGCPFRVSVKRQHDGSWAIIGCTTVQRELHNHEAVAPEACDDDGHEDGVISHTFEGQLDELIDQEEQGAMEESQALSCIEVAGG